MCLLKMRRQTLLQSLRNLKSAANSKGGILCVNDLRKFYQQNKLEKKSSNEVFVIDGLFGDGTESPIALVFSSRTCMKYLDQTVSTGAPLLALDGTFKLNSLGYPLLIVTTQDSLHQVFPIAFAPCSSECEETVTFVLTSVVKAYKLLYNKALNVKFFISDCALYMFSSVRKVFPALKAHISCYFHVKQSQKKRGMSDRGVHKDDRKAILSHLDVMHQMVTKEHFIKYWQLFKKEYLIYDDYCKYFEDACINSDCNLWHFFDLDANVFLANNCLSTL